MRIGKALSIILVVLGAALSWSQESSRDTYTKQEVNITMRDGAKLFTSIYVPKDTSQQWPMIMTRTPYSVGPYGADAYRTSFGPDGTYGKEKFIFVYQDVRGRYMSEGDFKWMTPFLPAKSGKMVDESTDTYDTIDWLIKNVPNNNGRVGMVGTSFPGHYVAQALLDPHPALKCASPQAPMADNWMGDDMHHNGAFFLPHAMNFIAGFGRKRDGPTTTYAGRTFSHGTQDGYKFFLEMGALPNAMTRYNMNQIELWKEWMAHGDYDSYWQAQNVPQHMTKVGHVAVMTVGGWWDAEDLQGPLKIYEAIEKNNPRTINTLIMGPWYHGSWNGGPGDALHDIKWETKTGEDFRKIQLNFFNYYLKDIKPQPVDLSGTQSTEVAPEALMFDVGADKWRTFMHWPPQEARPLQLGFMKGGKLDLGALPSGSFFDEYVSDPFKPVPNSATITTGMARSYMIEDQRFVANRPDVLSYETPTLTEDLTLSGPVKASLFVSTTGTDADFIVKLIDVFPNDYAVASPRQGAGAQMGGYQMMIRGEPMRAKYRNSWSKPSPLTPGKVERVEFAMPDVCYTFKKGHKVMVQVHSTWFPLIDRNPQRFLNIYNAKDSDFQKATHRVYLGGKTGSNLTVQVLK